MPRVLTVDDSKATRRMVRRHLKLLDLEIDEAQDGNEALKILETESYDLILLDVTMPICDGPTMLEDLRARGDDTPVIMLTAESGPIVEAAIALPHVIGYVLKPFSGDDIRPRVAEALGLGCEQATG